MSNCSSSSRKAIKHVARAPHQLEVISEVISVMSKSFLVESLLMTDGVRDACCSNNSKHLQCVSDAVADITSSHILTSRNEELKEGLTNRNKLLNSATTHAVADPEVIRQFAHEQQCHRPASYHSRFTTLLSHCRHPHVNVAVDEYVQLQTLAAIMHTSLLCDGSAQHMMNARCLAATHQRHHMHNVPQAIKLAAAAAGVIPFGRLRLADYQHHHDQHHHHEHQSRADVTSTTQSRADEGRYRDEFVSHDVMSGETSTLTLTVMP